MADKITGLGAQKLADGGGIRWSLFYTFNISPEIVDANGTKISPQQAINIAADHLRAYSPIQAERDTLRSNVDAGDVGYAVTTLDQTAGETNAAFLSRAKKHWTAIRDTLIQVWRDKYAKTGTAVNPTV